MSVYTFINEAHYQYAGNFSNTFICTMY